MTMKSCLLIIPRHFYSFEKHIRTALEDKGYAVTVSNDEYPEGTLGKIIGKLQIPLIFPVTCRIIRERFLDGRQYDLALIFKGRGISEQLLVEMRSSVKRIVGYNWDSFRLNRAPLRWKEAVDRYYTFDYRDADQWSLPVIELFSSSGTTTEKLPAKYQLSTVVRNHSRRIDYIDQVISILQPERVFISIFELNLFTFLFNFVTSPRLYFKYRKHISFRPLSYAEYSDVMRSSEFTIDYAHETQTGITMRCFEAINMQTKIITNNPYMSRSDHFDEADYVVFEEGSSPAGLIEAYNASRAQPYASKPRTIGNFIDELVAE